MSPLISKCNIWVYCHLECGHVRNNWLHHNRHLFRSSEIPATNVVALLVIVHRNHFEYFSVFAEVS